MPIMGGLASQLNFSVETMVMIYPLPATALNLFTPTSGAIMGEFGSSPRSSTRPACPARSCSCILGVVCMVILTAAMLILPGGAA